ncbi:MAG: ABC transporter ATP-binding protein [Rhodospirillaceae bacterium]|jgi:peptide/nickel transport system ATP-binding protein|nr:ABC transporter ATP-binding protein [Rhodospirillaceae bacterium]MBT8005218.1 ABC transporter ATP-binding protein [Rhodospirillales bacterium]MBT4700481.1 ABC transporter ATP-binding protein [Rhodospirillaceae bacterium]MBT5033449.1 ABC transporter ATP-binding protein [Rhodospirillaceae bacterium]MBT6221356.1 ABC transporter ATP-binding protein [Rhodospirillaceae bacterium]
MTDLLRVNNLCIDFQTDAGPIHALKGISFRIRQGSTVALVGESGSGKSVTGQAIMGILPKSALIKSGEILFTDPALRGLPGIPPEAVISDAGDDFTVDLARMNPDNPGYRAIRGDRISVIFQEPMTSMSPLHTIGNQISEALLLHRNVSDAEGRELTTDVLRLVGFPDPARAFDTYPHELSGGLRQRAMISMALVCRPALLIADEPSTALDVTIQAQILKLIQDLQKELGMAVLMITHDLGVVANVAEEVVVVYHGEVMESGSLNDIFNNPGHPYLQALLDAVPHFDMKPGERLKPLREIEHHTGHLLEAKEDSDDSSVDDGKPLLEVKHLIKRFSGRRQSGMFGLGDPASVLAVNDISFDLMRGECLGLVGESGCGKTTVSKMIMRAVEASGGEILYNNNGTTTDLLKLSAPEMIPIRRKIQYMFQDPFGSLNPRMTVLDILTEPLVIHEIGDPDYRRELATELIHLVGLDARHLNRYPHSFSGGQRQRIGIARSLALRPDLLICDEPVSALDVSIQAQILNLLKDLQQELGLTYLFISHNLAVVDYIAERIAVMCAGQIVEIAPRETLFNNPTHPYTKALVSAVPYPDPEQRLDFSALLEGKASEPGAWPEPFNAGEGQILPFVTLGDGHMVRAQSGAGLGEASE